MLQTPLDKGYLVACKVEVPGHAPINEYRLSAMVSESNQTWEQFKASEHAKLPSRALKIAKARPPRDAAASPPSAVSENGANILARLMTPLVAPVDTETKPKIAEPIHANKPDVVLHRTNDTPIVFMIDSNGCLRIEFNEETVICSNQETRDVGELLVASEPIWS